MVSLRGGAVSGFLVVALSLLGVSFIFLTYGIGNNIDKVPSLIVGFAFGASFVALFAQLGGGIYTKAADVGADLVGKIEANIPEDDPRNPAVIADLVGDNVGDCAGRGADLFESTAAENIGAMILGVVILEATGNPGWILFPLVMSAFGLIASAIGLLYIRPAVVIEPDKAAGRDPGEIALKQLNYWLLHHLCSISHWRRRRKLSPAEQQPDNRQLWYSWLALVWLCGDHRHHPKRRLCLYHAVLYHWN